MSLNRQIKILILGPVPPCFGGKSQGGIATHIKGFSEMAASKGHQSSIWYHKPNPEFQKEGIKVIGNSIFSYLIILKYVKLFFHRDLSYLNFFRRTIVIYQYARLKQILNTEKFDIIHIHAYFNTAGIALQLLGAPNPIVITDHGFWQEPNFESKMFQEMYLYNLRAASKIIYISEYSYKQNLAFNYGQLEKLVKLRNPINIEEDVALNSKNKSRKRVIFFNGITDSIKIKQLDVLLNAIEGDIFLKENIHLIVITNPQGMEFIKQHSFSFSIEAYKSLNWDTVKTKYEEIDLLVVPSKSECFATVYVEALSYGKPVVGFKDNIDEISDEYPTYIGEGYEGNDTRELAAKIRKVLDSKIDQNSLVNTTHELFSWNENFYKFESLFKEMIED